VHDKKIYRLRGLRGDRGEAWLYTQIDGPSEIYVQKKYVETIKILSI
jgi:hypothetical protein